jgi:hypothetical protein
MAQSFGVRQLAAAFFRRACPPVLLTKHGQQAGLEKAVANYRTPNLVQAAACPFCYTAAATARAGAIRALQSGILVLILPPILIFAAIAAFRRRHRYQRGSK